MKQLDRIEYLLLLLADNECEMPDGWRKRLIKLSKRVKD